MYEVKSQSHLPNSVTTPPNSQNNVFHLRGIHYFLCIENIAHVHAQTQYLFFIKMKLYHIVLQHYFMSVYID